MRDDLLRRLDAGHSGHVQVHDHDVGLELSHMAECLVAGRGLADHVDSLLLQQVAQACSEEIVIVHEQHPRMGLLEGGRRLDRFGHAICPFPPGVAATESLISTT